jgi:hypothetical protein
VGHARKHLGGFEIRNPAAAQVAGIRYNFCFDSGAWHRRKYRHIHVGARIIA